MRSWVASSSPAWVTEMPGKVVGMYIRVPSFRSGMNSEPSWRAGQRVRPSAATASRMVSTLALSTTLMTGR
ncbi:hypothetical protein CHKEEEPN_1104 [Methylorubrum podarium]|nr:hypothetical protein CHKEEEPN_1104 [Methylorubrum podarium]